MFWKRKKHRSDDETIHPQADQRRAFRYDLENADGISMDLYGTTVNLINLSAEGAAFKNPSYKIGDTERAGLLLTKPWLRYTTLVKVTIEVVDVDENNICHCLFKNCSDEDRESIHKYILERQKTDIRKSKRNDPPH
ncbi:MAG: PilZ domain-containing protein [Desulfobacteraceae bacterium]